MAIKGSLREASLPDVLQLLSMGKKTGCLSVTHRSSFAYIYFDDGRISYASIVNRRDRLGELLVKNGSITTAQLDEALAAQEGQPDKRIGDLLVASGQISRTTLHDYVRVQIEESVYLLFTWSEGTFNFEVGVRPDRQDLLVSITPESLLLEGARRVDEWQVIAQKIPTFDLVFDADLEKVAAANPELSAEQQTVLRYVNGRDDVAHIIDESHLAEFEVGKALYGLIVVGLVHRVGRTAKVSQISMSERIDEHRNLGVAFYRSGMIEEALREWRRVHEIKPDDAVAEFQVGLLLLRQGNWADALETLQSAAARSGARAGTFHNLAIVLERLGRYEEARAALDEARKRGGDKDPRVLMSIGVVSLLTGDLAAAEEPLAAAKPLWKGAPPPVWYHYAGLSAAMNGDLDRAAETYHEGLSHHPGAALLHNNLAVLLEHRGLHDEALACLERGIAEAPTMPQLHKNTGDLYYRAARYDEAHDAYVRALRSDEQLGGDVYFRLGNIQLRRHARADAMKYWKRSVELDPGNTIVRTNLEALSSLRD